MAETISAAVDAFFAEVESDDFETEDLAWCIVRALKREVAREAVQA
jgi:hypothetical protein